MLDHQYRKADCKHIHVILDIVKQNRGYANNVFRIMERSTSANIAVLAISVNVALEPTNTANFKSINVENVRNYLPQITGLKKPVLIPLQLLVGKS